MPRGFSHPLRKGGGGKEGGGGGRRKGLELRNSNPERMKKGGGGRRKSRECLRECEVYWTEGETLDD